MATKNKKVKQSDSPKVGQYFRQEVAAAHFDDISRDFAPGSHRMQLYIGGYEISGEVVEILTKPYLGIRIAAVGPENLTVMQELMENPEMVTIV